MEGGAGAACGTGGGAGAPLVLTGGRVTPCVTDKSRALKTAGVSSRSADRSRGPSRCQTAAHVCAVEVRGQRGPRHIYKESSERAVNIHGALTAFKRGGGLAPLKSVCLWS